jgi:hypothetical protein
VHVRLVTRLHCGKQYEFQLGVSVPYLVLGSVSPVSDQ